MADRARELERAANTQRVARYRARKAGLLPPMTHLRPIGNARCPGFGDEPEDWLEECHDCQRRTAPGGELWSPPLIVALWCEDYIPPDRPEDQQLRELARRQGVVE